MMRVQTIRKALRSGMMAGVFSFTTVTAVFAQPPSRITESMKDGQTYPLSGQTHPRIHTAIDLGEVPATEVLDRITLYFAMSASQRAKLMGLLADQQNSKSAQYHRWLTPEQYGAEFGVSESDLSSVEAWLHSQGFTTVEKARGRDWISVSGTAKQVQTAFQTSIHRYQTADGNHFANANDPIIPHALAGFVSGISGLNDFRPTPRAHASRRRLDPHFTSSISGNHFLAPGDFATIYDVTPLYAAGLDGTGQKIAIPGQTDIDIKQVSAFRVAAGLSANPPQVYLSGADPGVSANDQMEAYLDIEWAGAVARNATIVYVASKNVDDAIQYAINNNVASVLSITYGLCEQQFGDTTTYQTLLQQANTQGMTVVAAAGDTGAADCDGSTNPSSSGPKIAKKGLGVDYPASSPFVTGVGGTEYLDTTNASAYWASSNDSSNASALSYIPEQVWNDTVSGGQLSAGGGGVSTLFPKPSWQTGDAVPNDGQRDVPDVVFNASVTHDEYLICGDNGTVPQTSNGQTTTPPADCTSGFRNVNQDLDPVGGTSAGAPTMAGVVALLNQAYGGSQGNINPRLYALAASTSNVFHDVTSGDNTVPCQTGTTDCSIGRIGYPAGIGYDLASGLGSLDVANLVNSWASSFFFAASPSAVTLAPASSSTINVQVNSLGGFASSIGLTCTVSGALVATTCTIPTSVVAPGSLSVVLKNSNAAEVMPLPVSLPWNSLGSGTLAVLLAAGALLFFRDRRPAVAVSGCALGFLLATTAMSGCGGGTSTSGSGTTTVISTPVTGTVTLSGTSGGITRSVAFSVTQD